MKKILLPVTFVLLPATQTAGAQNVQTSNSAGTFEYSWATQTIASGQHAAMLDKLQKETEELILNVAPAPFVSLAHLIDHKLADNKSRRAERKANKSASSEK